MKSILDLLAKRRRRIVGLMSGTSADGVDAALVEIESLAGRGVAGSPDRALTWDVLDFVTVPYPDAVRAEILGVQEGGERVLERLTRLHFILGHFFADAVEAVSRDAGVPLSEVDAVASHGQTVCHFPVFPSAGPPREGAGAESWGRADRGGAGWVSASTLQIGEPAVLAERLGVCVISNFRSRDVAVGGTGAPLVPLVDHLLFADPSRSRMALNVGGIANITAIRAGAGRDEVIAFDTGPGNMVLDALMGIVSDGRKHVDEGGALAAKGNPDRELVEEVLREPFFAQAPPRAAGREQFGAEFTRALLDRCRAKKLSDASVLATTTMLTARAVEHAYRSFVEPGFAIEELIVSGGGAHNVTLLHYLSDLFQGAQVVTSDYYGLDVDAKEAVAFALLGHLTLEGEAGNLPGVTGASRPVLLGDITPGDRFL
jgi:anhydro-N-acetylmuramic acid kinase